MSEYLRPLGRALSVAVGLSGAALCGDALPAGASPIIPTIAERAPSDEQVTYRVEARLRTDGRIDWELLDVEVQQGAVTLYGEVLTEDQKGLASVIASTVPGVTRLINRILVDQALSGDSRLRKSVWRTVRGVEALRDQTQT